MQFPELHFVMIKVDPKQDLSDKKSLLCKGEPVCVACSGSYSIAVERSLCV